MEGRNQNLIHPTYLPFTPAQLRHHFMSASEAHKQVSQLEISAKALSGFL